MLFSVSLFWVLWYPNDLVFFIKLYLKIFGSYCVVYTPQGMGS